LRRGQLLQQRVQAESPQLCAVRQLAEAAGGGAQPRVDVEALALIHERAHGRAQIHHPEEDNNHSKQQLQLGDCVWQCSPDNR
jgi:hypothetical protein